MAAQTATGIPSFIGYEYQILATVWAGLDLIIRRACCDRIIVEPASEEDIAAQLRVDTERATATLRTPFPDEYPVEVQIKLRRSAHWTPTAFALVLNGANEEPGTRGPARRTRPIQNLINTPSLRYTLLTDARVNEDLSAFRVANVGELSTATALPPGVVVPGAAATANRVGVFVERTPEVLRFQIAECLRLVHVPGTKHDACLHRLQHAVRSRLLGHMTQEWNRAEIEAIISGSDGYPEMRKPSPLVKPTNYANLQRQLAENHVLLITGPPGAGKTHVANHLAQEHRLDDDPFEIVEVHGADWLSKIRARLDGDGRVLFFIHDPWGMYEAGDRAQEWATELPKLANRATAAKKFLITSRTAIKEEHIPAEFRNVLTAADSPVTEANYTEADRSEILSNALRGANSVQTDFAVRHRQQIVAQLRLPLAIDSFARNLMGCSMESEPSLEELIRSSNVETIGRTIQQEIDARGEKAVSGAVILWSLFTVRQLISPQDASEGRRDVVQGGYVGRTDPEGLLNHFIRSKWLRPAADGDFSAHPTFIEGLDRIVQEHPGIAEEVLLALLAGMCANGKTAKTRGILRHLRRRNTPIPTAAQATLNRHLLEQIGRIDRYDPTRTFAELAEYGEGNDPVMLLARTLMTGPVNDPSGFPARWRPAALSDADVAAIRASTAAEETARVFARFALLDYTERRYEAPDLVAFFMQFCWNLTPQFFEALGDAFEHASSQAATLAHAVLLGNQPPYDAVLNSALEQLDRVNRSLDEMQGRYRSAEQGELDGEESRHIYEQPSELLYPPEEVLKLVVKLRRARDGYAWVASHARVADLLEAWVGAIAAGAADEEVEAIFARCPANDRRLGWQAVGRAQAGAFMSRLLAALTEAPQHELSEVWAAINAIIPWDDWPARVMPIVRKESLCRRAQLASAIKHAHSPSLDPSKSDEIVPLLFTPAEMLALDACKRWEGSDSIRELVSKFAEPERAALRELTASPDEELGAQAGLVLHELGEDVEMFLKCWAHSRETNARFYAYHLAGLLDSKAGHRLLRRHGITDVDYRCRRVALYYLASMESDIDWILVRRAAKDASAPVRDCCAQMIGQYRHQAGERTLLTLLRDTRDRSEDHFITIYGGCIFHVARAAAEALGRLRELSPEATADLVAFLRCGEASCPDWVVHYHTVNCLAWRRNPDLLPLFVDYLADARHLHGPSKAGFPIRFGAAWGVANTLGEDPARAGSIDLGKVLEGARHHDHRLTGPCLIALGFIDPQSREAAREVIRGSEELTNRAALYVLGAAIATGEAPQEFEELVGPQHACLEIVKQLKSETTISNAVWCDWLGQHPDVRKWLDGIQSSEGFHPALRFALWVLLGQAGLDLLSVADLQANDLAEKSPLVTMRTLFGGE